LFSTLNPQPSTLNTQPSALSPQLSTLNPQPVPGWADKRGGHAPRQRVRARRLDARRRGLLSSFHPCVELRENLRSVSHRCHATLKVWQSTKETNHLPVGCLPDGLLLSSPELSDAKVYEPSIRACLGTTAHFCEVVVPRLSLRSRPVSHFFPFHFSNAPKLLRLIFWTRLVHQAVY